MGALKNWAVGRPLIIEQVGIQMATTAHEINEAFQHIKARKFFSYQFPLPNLPSWFRLYRKHNEVEQFLTTLLGDFSALTNEQVELSQGIFEVASKWGQIDKSILSNITQEDITQAVKSLRGLSDALYVDVEKDLNPDFISSDEQDEIIQFLNENELSAAFFILVHVPCWILYRMSPSILYRRARQGDIDSLEKLLRLDALMIHDPSIGRQVQRFRFNRKTTVYGDLMKAPLEKPKGKITRKTMKYIFAGFISAVAQIYKHPLTEPEIRSLFDAVSKDAGRGSIDTDLPDSPDSFSKAVRRYREFWLKSFQSDKKS